MQEACHPAAQKGEFPDKISLTILLAELSGFFQMGGIYYE
jgi:hypothetical protein